MTSVPSSRSCGSRGGRRFQLLAALLVAGGLVGCGSEEAGNQEQDWTETDFSLHWAPESGDWDIVGVVDQFDAATPEYVRDEVSLATADELRAGMAFTYEAAVREYESAGTKDAAVEYATALIDVPYADFAERLPAAQWGVALAHYLGGEVAVAEADAQGRAVRQVERMVLSAFPCDLNLQLANLDMTKVEVIEYSEQAARIRWRVMYSDNDSTEMDVGYVAFESFDADSTLVTFHSAHRLNMAFGIHLANSIVVLTLGEFFLDHIEHYRELVTD